MPTDEISREEKALNLAAYQWEKLAAVLRAFLDNISPESVADLKTMMQIAAMHECCLMRSIGRDEDIVCNPCEGL